MKGDGIDEIAVARRNRELSIEVTDLAAANEALRTAVAELRRTGIGDLKIAPGEHSDGHSDRCHVIIPGTGAFHVNVELHPDDRRVVCRRCKTQLDAFDVLLQYANGERRFAYTLELMRGIKASLEADIAKLKQERSTVKAGIRRAKKPAP